MKHCPNPACGGLEKFGIISEYNDTSDVCADCGADLAAGPAPERLPDDGPEPDPDMNLVPVFRIVDPGEVALVESLLSDAGIAYLARGEQIQDLFGMGRLVAVNPITGPVEFLVVEDDADAAREVLAALFDEESEAEE